MTLFNQSVKAVSAVVQEIADSVGASGDPEMQNRSYRSLCAGITHFNNRANWDFLLVEPSTTTILGPFGIAGITASAGQTSALAPVGHGLLVDDILQAPGLTPVTRVSATAAGSIGLNQQFDSTIGGGNVVLSATAARDVYPLPADWKAPYTVRLYGSHFTLRPIRRRFFDRSISTEDIVASSPVGYDVFLVGSKGKIRLLPIPIAADVMQLRYYRRMTVPTTSATADPLDIPQDYEPYLIAWAKWHFITDKGEGRAEQGQTWMVFAQDGLKTMLADQARVPDEDLMFQPGAFTYNPTWNPNSTRGTDWIY